MVDAEIRVTTISWDSYVSRATAIDPDGIKPAYSGLGEVWSRSKLCDPRFVGLSLNTDGRADRKFLWT